MGRWQPMPGHDADRLEISAVFVLNSCERMTITVKKEFRFMFATLLLERQLPAMDELNRRLSARILERDAQ